MEMKELGKFIASPYFLRTRDLNPLFKALKKFYPSFTDSELNSKNIFMTLYPDKSYDGVRSDNLIKTLSSEMYRMCKDFLVQSEFMNDEKRREYYLLNQLRKKKLGKEFEKDMKRIEEEDKFRNKGSIEFFIEKILLRSVFRDYSLDNDDFKNTYESALSIGEYTAVMALIKCLRNTDEKTLAGIYNLETRYNLTENLLKHLNIHELIKDMKINNDRFYPYIFTYYLIYRLNTEKSKTVYFELKDHVDKNAHIFGKDELYVLRSILLTFCSIMAAGKEGKQFMREQFELNDGNLKLGFYKRGDNEDFHVVLFRNMVINSGMIGETEWLENFIEKYSPELPEDHRENMINFSRAYLHLSKKEYGKALEYFAMIRLNLFIFKIDVRIFQLRIYYELEHFDQAHSLLDATAHFLNDTEEASPILMDSTRNFIKYFRILLKIKRSGKPCKTQLGYLKKQIAKEEILASRGWLEEKTDTGN